MAHGQRELRLEGQASKAGQEHDDGRRMRCECACGCLNSGPVANHKTFCQQIAPQGWSYGGFLDGFYLFQKGDYGTGFVLMECLEEDLTAENLALMARMGITRDRSHRPQ